MLELTVVDWTRWDDPKYPEAPYDGEHEDVLHKYLVEKKYSFAGDFHQHGYGVPVFSDGTKMEVSMRSWGRIMADVWNEIDPEGDYDYMDFYMGGYGKPAKGGVPR